MISGNLWNKEVFRTWNWHRERVSLCKSRKSPWIYWCSSAYIGEAACRQYAHSEPGQLNSHSRNGVVA